jgi:hypothetical protein
MSLSSRPAVCVGAFNPATIRSGVICRICHAVVFAFAGVVVWHPKHCAWKVAQPLSVPGPPAPRPPGGGPAAPCARGAAGAAGAGGACAPTKAVKANTVAAEKRIALARAV